MSKRPKIISLIPARSGSVSIKDKNIKKLNGVPMLAWSIINSLKSPIISKTILSTDSTKYATIGKKYGADVPFLRPKNISGNLANDYEVINHFIKFFRNTEIDFDYIVFLRPTTPLRNPKIITKAIKSFLDSNCNALRSVHEMSETSYKTFTKSKKKLKPLFKTNKNIDFFNKPRQFFKKTYCANGYIDIFKKKYIIKNKRLFGKNVLAFETENAIEIDLQSDLDYLNYYLKINKDFKKELLK